MYITIFCASISRQRHAPGSAPVALTNDDKTTVETKCLGVTAGDDISDTQEENWKKTLQHLSVGQWMSPLFTHAKPLLS